MILAPRHLAKLTQTVDLFARYGLAEFAREQGLDPLQRSARSTGVALEASVETAEKFRKRLLELGPAYIKLGQLLSSRTDLLPETYIHELQKLESEVEPAPYEAIAQIVEEDLGASISQVFGSFEREPIGSASLGQAHVATLRDGREVIVKVQRPDIHELIAGDMAYFRELATFLTAHTSAGRKLDLVNVIGQLEQVLADELDYRIEARNTQHFRRAVAQYKTLTVPRIVEDLSTARVLTMERVHGIKVTEIAPVTRTEVDLTPLADDLVRAYVKHIAIDGHFHADPHPGNVFVVLRPGQDPQLAIIDFGMTARLGPAVRAAAVRVLFGLAEDRGDDVAEALADSGEALETFNRVRFVHEVSQIVSRSSRLSSTELDAGTVLYDILNAAMQNGLRPAAELPMLAKALAQLGIVTRALDPDFKPLSAVRRSMSEVALHQARAQFNPRLLWRVASEAAAVLGVLPRRIDAISKHLANNEFVVKHDIPQVTTLLEGLQKVANRILTGLVLAGLLVASALLMPQHNVLGTSGFLIAGALALYMVATILISDIKAKKKA